MSVKYKENGNDGVNVEVKEYEIPNFYRKPSSKELAACRPCRVCLIVFFVLTLIGLLAASVVLIAITEKCSSRIRKFNMNAGDTVYQVYVKKFCDSDRDGYGDINGLVEKLPYIKSMGINTILLNDVISDLNFELDSNIGKMKDFETFLKKCKEQDMFVLLQMNPLTLSVESDWFKDSMSQANPKSDWFIWSNETNGWLTKDNKTAWFKNGSLYYYSPYSEDQPALNYQNDGVITAVQNKLKYWLKQEINGFLMTDISRITVDKASTNQDLQSAHNVMRKLYETVQEGGGLLWTIPGSKNATSYLGIPKKREADRIVDDNLAMLSSPLNIIAIKDNINATISSIPVYGKIAWLLGGPRYQRVAARIKKEEAALLNLLLLVLPGKVLPYYGDELSLRHAPNASSACNKWEKRGHESNSSVNGFEDLVNIRNKQSLEFDNRPKLFLKDDVISFEYSNKIVTFLNFGNRTVTIDAWSGSVMEANILYSTNTKRATDSILSLNSSFFIDPYEVTLAQVKK